MRSLYSVVGTSFRALSNLLLTHSLAIKLGTIADVYTCNNILNGYWKCKEFRSADVLFDEMPLRDSVSWNTMIGGYINSGNLENSWEVLKCMRRCGLDQDEYTFGSMLKGIACAGMLDLGQQIHSMIIKMGFAGNVYAGSALLDMYAKCERLEDAYLTFLNISKQNTVSWNAMIAGYAQMGDRETAFSLLDCMEQEECGSLVDAKRVFNCSAGVRDLVSWNSLLGAFLVHNQEDLAFKLFIDMQEHGFEPDLYSYTSIISACFNKELSNNGKSLHGMVIKRGLEESVPISNALISMYLKSDSGSMKEALCIFESLEIKDRVSWNSILTGLSQMGSSEDAVKSFLHMRSLAMDIDQYSFSAVLKSCSDLATFQLGQQFHVLALKYGMDSNEFVSSSLIFMYSKCGIMEDAKRSFEGASKSSSITWNALMFGYAQHGQCHVALDLFSLMEEKKVKMDHITFVAVLTACSHIGLVERGCEFLRCMESVYGVPPRMEHYACAVDLYGRSGRLDEAKALIEEMPFKPNAMVWKTFLGACRSCGNVELACQVARHLLEMEPEEHCTYVLLSNMYGDLMRWEEKAKVKRLMKERGVKKTPGWSWIEVKNKVHAFIAEDHSHPSCQQIYVLLEVLMEEITRIEATADGFESFLEQEDLSYAYA
ncbi:putative pentatricopeptide repeat-containing protein At3g25970 isoform X2 [Cucurbita pepo subsp. pepo]|uniref:putative pentatricopeptide repeat-containing protein At3g25970 isoform X2 n=1 Tax=Cucurbita pepo subsp. pepo TaxID=3664 RepID=UPI000C9D4AD1|nr:putative pentatricopeptide repeat-containing protein At3g25970 isoform X2 [Cucurbita pepo subsp. pepo]